MQGGDFWQLVSHKNCARQNGVSQRTCPCSARTSATVENETLQAHHKWAAEDKVEFKWRSIRHLNLYKAPVPLTGVLHDNYTNSFQEIWMTMLIQKQIVQCSS